MAPDHAAAKQDNSTKPKGLVDTILDNMVDGVITINAEGKIQSFNKACTRLFGYTLDEVLEKNINILMPQPYRDEHDGYLHNYQTTKHAKIIGIGREVSAQRKDGTVFPIDLAVGEIKNGGRHAFVGILRDLTERKEAEKAHEQLRQSQKMESLGQLTGGLAHDFNNLLAVIIGNLDLLAEKFPEDDPVQKLITPCLESALHGSEMTQRLLAFGRRQTLMPKIISLNELILYFSTWVKRLLGERIEIICKSSDDLWNVNVDPGQLQDVLLNLSVNARDAMPNGGKLIFETKNMTIDDPISAQLADIQIGDYVMLAVSDTGEGMTKEVMEKAFDPFFTTKEVGKGSGLGLSMVYGFVKQSAGHIQIYSEPGHGTSFKIFLPRSHKQETSSKKTKPISVRKASGVQHVLIVEDNKNVLALTSQIIESLGYEVVQAETGEEALAVLEKRSDIDLLLTDVMLPGETNGPEVAKLAVAMYPSLKVIYMSGYAEHAILEKGLIEEGVPLISKPFRKQQLAMSIREVFRQS